MPVCVAPCSGLRVCCGLLLLVTGKPGTKRDHDGNTVQPAAGGQSTPSSKRSKAKEAQDANMTDAGVEAAAAAGAPGERPHYTDEHTVFVKGLGFDVHEEDLRRLFAELGVKSVRMGRDKVTGASRVSRARCSMQGILCVFCHALLAGKDGCPACCFKWQPPGKVFHMDA